MNVFIIPNPMDCGMGQGEQCCAYLLMGGDGFICGRKSLKRNPELLDHMTSKRKPESPYPECQTE